MDLAAFEAALPAEIVAAVATTPNGLTAAAQVYVEEERRTDGNTDPEVWIRPPDEEEAEEAGLGDSGDVHSYVVEMQKTDLTRAERLSWQEQIREFFDGSKNPASITGHRFTEALNFVQARHSDEGPVEALMFLLIAHGVTVHG